MFSMCSELTPRARIPDTRIPQLMQPCPCIGKGKSFNEDEVLNQAVEFWASSVSSRKQKEAQILWRAGSVSLLVMLYSQYTFFFGRVGPDFLKAISYFSYALESESI